MRASIEPAWAAKAIGNRSRDGDSCNRTAVTTTTGMSAATAPLTLINAVRPAHSSIVSTSRRVRLASGVRHELLADPRGHAGGVQRLADDEQGGDVHDGRIAEPGERLVDVQDTGCPQRQRRTHGHDLDGHPVGHEQHDHGGEDQEDDRAVGHDGRA